MKLVPTVCFPRYASGSACKRCCRVFTITFLYGQTRLHIVHISRMTAHLLILEIGILLTFQEENPVSNCASCKFSALCFGLGMQAVLQSVVDSNSEYLWTRIFENHTDRKAFEAMVRAACPFVNQAAWYIVYGGDSKINVHRNRAYAEIK